MYIPIGPSKKQLYKIIIALLLLCYLIFLGMYKPKALTYNVDVTYKGNVLVSEQTGEVDLVTSGLPAREFVININKNISCDTDFCIITIPYTISWSSSDGQTSHEDIKSFYAITYGASPNSSCSLNSGTIDCVVANNTTLPKVEFFISPIETNPYTTLTYRVGGYCNIYSMVNVGSAINGIQNNTNDIKNSINDSSIDNSSANDLTNNSAFQDSNGLDNIIKAPLNFIQSLTNTTCSPINLTIPFMNADVSLPCMSSVYTKALGSQLVNTISLVINGIVLYRFCLVILNIVHNAKNPNKDELEVLDL